MKVKDLLKALEKAPSDKEVVILDSDWGRYDIRGIYFPVEGDEGIDVVDIEIERWSS